MNVYQKLGIALLSLTAITQVLPAKAATLTSPYPVNMNSNSNTISLPDMATLLSDCNSNGGQVGTGKDPSNPNSPVDGSAPSKEVPEPTAIAGMALAAGLGTWWKKKIAQKVAQES